METLYGNQLVRQNLAQMAAGNRLAHGFLFYGEPGLGKKTLARWFSALLCCTGTHPPCGICKSCRYLQKENHPDVLWVPHSGKLGGFSVETVRSVIRSAAVPPNEGQRKLYIFADCDQMDVRAQNLLLKLIEEPPDYVYFIFTASTRNALLPTVCSRIVPFGISPCTETECRAVLAAHGYGEEDCREAVRACHGNAGNALAFLEQPEFRETVALTRQAVQCLLNRKEYELLRIFSVLGKERFRAERLIRQLDQVVRDAMVLRFAPELPCVGCDPDGAAALASRISSETGQQYHAAVNRAIAALKANVNVQLVLSAMGAELMQCGR